MRSFLWLTLVIAVQTPSTLAQSSSPTLNKNVFGFHDFSQQAKWDAVFLAIPEAQLAGQHLKTLTKAPHWASSPEDYATAMYVADKFRAAGLETEVVPYRVLLNKPVRILIEAWNESGRRLMTGPSPEHVDAKKDGGDPFQDDARVLPAFNGSSPSGDVTAEVVYANYGSPADFKKLLELGVSVKGKVVLVRYGANYRGVKVYDAQQNGAKGVLIYSDPADDGYARGDMYPKGPYRPASGVQRGATQFLPIYPGDATTPGVSSTMDLPASKRIPVDKIQANWPSIPVNPLSYLDASPILRALGGPATPRTWQGALPFTYHTGGMGGSGSGKVTVHMQLKQDTALRVIWDVIGKIPGTDFPREWVIAGNHRDAWVYGAVDPNSGTAAMLETVHGLGELLKRGWKPKRTIMLGSWDAEEEGLIGSTEWVEDHPTQMRDAVAYLNTDSAVSGPNFNASAIPSLKQFVREVTMEVSSPAGGTVYEQWLKEQNALRTEKPEDEKGTIPRQETKPPLQEARVGDLGSGSDYTAFLQHEGVPATDIGSTGPYGVYHSVFDNYNWFVKFADPTFVYEQQQACVFGLEILHMADADVLPYDFETYGRQIVGYVEAADARSKLANMKLEFTSAKAAATRFAAAGSAVKIRQLSATADNRTLNLDLRLAEAALLNPEGLPHRSWYKHTVYAPGEYTGYEAVVIPGVNEGIDAVDTSRTQVQLEALSAALNRASAVLERASK